ncbi:MAG: cyclic nucleotide-binding domain-containing protein [Streptococcaceae bacterium]|nr:cyclic nucleotide-binding domain-containing protein [Streptococcaceae bacterium]
MKIYQLASDGKEQLLRVLEPGGYEGEQAIFGVTSDNLFGEAMRETTICYMRQSDFKAL